MKKSTSPPKINVGILGATGMVGQRLVQRLHKHSQFKIAYLGASERSAEKRYDDAVAWRLESKNPLPDMKIQRCSPNLYPANVPLLFSALDGGVAKKIEAEAKNSGRYVVSNASAFRMDANVPLFIP